jgi:hypothetical protein
MNKDVNTYIDYVAFSCGKGKKIQEDNDLDLDELHEDSEDVGELTAALRRFANSSKRNNSSRKDKRW